MIISDESISDRSVLNHFVCHHGIEISLECMANNYLRSVIKFCISTLFIGKYFRVLTDSPKKLHVLDIININVWEDHFILVKLDLYIVDVHSSVPVVAILGDIIYHLLNIWNFEDIRNYFLVQPELDK